MILCSCNTLTCHEVRAATREAMTGNVHHDVSPGRVFRLCGRRVCCGACKRLVHQTITEHSAALRAERNPANP